jgi:hypothetical protein
MFRCLVWTTNWLPKSFYWEKSKTTMKLQLLFVTKCFWLYIFVTIHFQLDFFLDHIQWGGESTMGGLGDHIEWSEWGGRSTKNGKLNCKALRV